MSNEIANVKGNVQGGDMPDWLKNQEAQGHEDVEDNSTIQEFRVATKMSSVLDRNSDVSRGDIYNAETDEPLGDTRKLLIFKKRKNHVMLSEDGWSLCKSYDRQVGNVRTYQDKEHFDDEVIEEFGLTEEDVENENKVSHECASCSFHPTEGWKTIDGKPVPPRCNESHEYYVLDLTEGVNKVPYLIRIGDTSKIKSDIIDELDAAISHKLKFQGAPLYAGIFEFGTKQVENSRGNKFFVWDISFDGYVPDQGLFEFAKMMHEDFNKKEQEMEQLEQESRTKDVTPESEEESWSGDGDEDDDEVPF